MIGGWKKKFFTTIPFIHLDNLLILNGNAPDEFNKNLVMFDGTSRDCLEYLWKQIIILYVIEFLCVPTSHTLHFCTITKTWQDAGWIALIVHNGFEEMSNEFVRPIPLRWPWIQYTTIILEAMKNVVYLQEKFGSCGTSFSYVKS